MRTLAERRENAATYAEAVSELFRKVKDAELASSIHEAARNLNTIADGIERHLAEQDELGDTHL
jgi:hypothetical protein